jgi:hypothetical protein
MKLLPFAVLACLAATPVAAQQSGIAPHLQLHAVNPSMSLSAPTNNPLQEQMRENYATGLMGLAARASPAEPIGFRSPGAGDRQRTQPLYAALAENRLSRLP